MYNMILITYIHVYMKHLIFTVRQLLGGDGGGSSSSGSSSKNKNKEKQKEEKKGDKEAVEIHCCGEDGCNGSIRLSSSTYSPLVIIFSFLLPTLLLSNSFSPCHYTSGL